MVRVTRIASVVLLIINGFTAIAGGLLLVLEPDGRLLHISVLWLKGLALKNYLLPGFILLFVIGFFSIYADILIITCYKYAPAYMAVEGFFLLVWTIVQVLTFSRLSFLQPVYGFVAIALLLFGFILSKYQNDTEENMTT